MPKIEIKVKLSPDDFRKMLPVEIQNLFDGLVKGLQEVSALSEDESKAIIANELWEVIVNNGGVKER
jgi:hypothetical protein